MKQYQTVFQNAEQFSQELQAWKQDRAASAKGPAIAHFFSDGAPHETVLEACRLFRECMPDIAYVGSAASGNLSEGLVSEEKLVVTLTSFEHENSFVKTVLFPVENYDAESFRRQLQEMKDDFQGVKAAEIILTIDSVPIREVCQILQEEIPAGIPIFGGGAFGDNTFQAFVFQKGSGAQHNGLIMTLLGGEDFHVSSRVIMGWKPLGQPLKVTSAEGKVIHTLNGTSAYDIYHHYLRIPRDENLFYNALEFPFLLETGETQLLRHALSCEDDGSLVMSTDIPEGSVVHTTYGDPDTILKNVQSGVEAMGSFYPEVIAIFDCFGRKTFWGNNKDASRETTPFHMLAPTYGFCTSGELIRTGKTLEHHNLSLVVTGMREGGPVERGLPEVRAELTQAESTMSLVSRLVNFINTATAEVIEANRTLEQMAITDRLTGLYNRGEIQRRITERVSENQADPTVMRATSLIMMDLDDFKKVNDHFGHKEGDNVLMAVSRVIRESVTSLCCGACAGRWGGEEFMIMIPGVCAAKAQEIAKMICGKIGELTFELCGHVTASLGVAYAKPHEEADPLAIRVDHALYEAKHAGKNCVVVAE